MKRFHNLLIIALFLLGCSTHSPTNSITQTSTINALLAGIYDGEMTCHELLGYGNFGIGTFDRLDGEMVILNGHVYQVKADGHVYQPPYNLKTPFAAVSHFNTDQMLRVDQTLDYPGLKQRIDTHISDPHLFYSIRITGYFSKIHTRSVPAQEKPYPPLAEVTKNQPEFKMTNVSGTIVGFWCPQYVKGLNVPGYHLHFISDDRQKGGHILGFELEEGLIEIDSNNKFVLIMPQKSDELSQVNLSRDRGEELERVEK